MYALQERFFPFIGENVEHLNICVEDLVTSEIKHGRSDPATVYTFFIDAIGRLLEADYFGGVFAADGTAPFQYKTSSLLNFPEDLSICTEFSDCKEGRPLVNLAKWNVACDCEKPHSLFRCIQYALDQQKPPAGRPSDRCKGFAYPLLNFAVIYNARHRAAASRVIHDNTLTMEAEVVDVSTLFPVLRVNRRMEWCDPDGKRYSGTLPDPRFAMLYECARRRAAIEVSLETYIANRQEICRLLPANRDIEGVRYYATEDPPVRRVPRQFQRNRRETIASADELSRLQRTILRWMGLEIKAGFLVKKSRKDLPL